MDGRTVSKFAPLKESLTHNGGVERARDEIWFHIYHAKQFHDKVA
jgi:hypothetical protein